MKNISIEEATETHLEEMRRIYNYYVLNSTATWHETELAKEDMKDLIILDNDMYGTFVILDDGTVCGYASIRAYKAREGYNATAEIGIYLSKDCTGRGLAAEALRRLEAFAVDKGLHVLIATITSGNVASIKLFEKNGYEKCAYFKEVGMKFGKYLDAVTYQKILI